MKLENKLVMPYAVFIVSMVLVSLVVLTFITMTKANYGNIISSDVVINAANAEELRITLSDSITILDKMKWALAFVLAVTIIVLSAEFWALKIDVLDPMKEVEKLSSEKKMLESSNTPPKTDKDKDAEIVQLKNMLKLTEVVLKNKMDDAAKR